MQVLRAQHMGMCFGVKRAIVQAIAAAERVPLTILGELVHNDAVLADLRARGIRTCGEVDEIGTSTVMITAHGASECRIARVKARRLNVLNATCPLVQRGAQGRGAPRLRRVPPGHRGTEGSRRSARHDGGPGRVRRRAHGRRCRSPSGTAGVRRRGPDDAAGRAAEPHRRTPPTTIPPVQGRGHEHGVPPYPAAPGRGRGAGPPGRHWSSLSAVPGATTPGNWSRPAAGTARASTTSRRPVTCVRSGSTAHRLSASPRARLRRTR